MITFKNLFTASSIAILSLFASCSDDDTIIPKDKEEKLSLLKIRTEQNESHIGVFGTQSVTIEQYTRAYTDVKLVMDKMDDGIRQGLLDSKAKIIVAKNEDEVEENIKDFKKLIPTEIIYVDNEGVDETKADATDVGLSATKLEMMYLCVYYSLLTDKDLDSEFTELKDAYKEATDAKIFTPDDAYKDGEEDDAHENASEKNALKYGSYLFNLYKLYFGNDQGQAGEFTITTKAELEKQNAKGFRFVRKYFDLNPVK